MNLKEFIKDKKLEVETVNGCLGKTNMVTLYFVRDTWVGELLKHV